VAEVLTCDQLQLFEAIVLDRSGVELVQYLLHRSQTDGT
jgi:hypothetical protein